MVRTTHLVNPRAQYEAKRLKFRKRKKGTAFVLPACVINQNALGTSLKGLLNKGPLVAALALSLGACGGSDGASPETTQAKLQSSLPALVDSTVSSMDFVGQSEQWTNLMTSLDTVDLLLPFTETPVEEPLPAAGEEDPLTGAEVADLLTEQIFNEANYEGGGNYRLSTDLLCPEEFIYDPDQPDLPEVPTVDQECLDMVAALEPRVHVQEAGDGLDFTLMIGADRAEPISLELRSDRITLATDLADVKQAANSIATASGEAVELPAIMEGVVAATLRSNGPQDISVEFAVREALNISGSFPDTGDVAFSTAAADPIFSVRLNGADEEVTASMDVGRTQLSLPWASVDELSNATGTFALDWQGHSITAFLSEAQEGISLSNLGLGDGTSTIKLDEFTLFSLDLNADAGRRFAMDILAAADSLPTFTFDPKMSLAMHFDFSPLADAGDEVASYMLGETYTIDIDGDTPTLQPFQGAIDGGIKVVSGQMRIASSADNGNVTVDAGSCLLASEVLPEEHEILGAFASGTCPE